MRSQAGGSRLAGFKFTADAKGGKTGLSYQLIQMKGRGGGDGWDLKAVGKHQSWSQRLCENLASLTLTWQELPLERKISLLEMRW